MEGDWPTGAMVLYEYIWLLGFLENKKKEAIGIQSPLVDMFVPMITLTKKYLALALKCEVIIMATILNPLWRLKLFEEKLSTHIGDADQLLRSCFSQREKKLKQLAPIPDIQETTRPEAEDDDGFNFFPMHGKSGEENDELQRYITNGQYPMAKKSDLLGWWKVCTRSILLNKHKLNNLFCRYTKFISLCLHHWQETIWLYREVLLL